jgi:deoxyguanosine kinase
MYRYIAVSGTIGAGKTELAAKLSKDLHSSLIPEEFASNTFLEKFYNDPERYAFPLEISFLFERFQQLKTSFAKADIFNPSFISDYFFDKSLLFAKHNLSNDQFSIFLSLFTAFREQLPLPDLLIYLHRPADILLKNIHLRGRIYEQGITSEYLSSLQVLYLDYFRKSLNTRIIILKLEQSDFKAEPDTYNTIKELCSTEHDFGIKIIEF